MPLPSAVLRRNRRSYSRFPRWVISAWRRHERAQWRQTLNAVAFRDFATVAEMLGDGGYAL